IVISGTGVLWSNAQENLQRWVEKTGMPLYTTPQGRGAVPEDHSTTLLNARSTALREADYVLVVGTRLNYVFGQGLPPRFNADATLVRIDVDPMEIGSNDRVNIGIVGDADSVLQQLLEEAGSEVN